VVSISASLIIGLIAGVIVVFSVLGFDRAKIDDPVGAISVHLTCGIWGTLAVGIWGAEKSFMIQLIAVLAYGVFCFVSALILFGILKATLGIRVDAEEELRGLDIGEHGMEAYSGFQIFSNQ
jgi:Amt family ammonium transporter